MAAQQAMQMSQQATQQAMQDMQQASQQAQQASQQAMQDAQNAAQNSGPVVAYTSLPVFSVKPGTVAQDTAVRIKCATHYAVIYYTTNGWTPTTASRRYTGPIPIHATTRLQAMAQAPNMAHSLIARADYTVKAAVQPLLSLTVPADGVLPAKTRLHLLTNSAVNSKTAQVGDSVDLLLDQDVKVGEAVVLPKGTPVDAILTQADPAGHAGAPGDLAFEVRSLSANGVTVPLQGGETLEGANHYKARNFMFIPVVGVIPALMTRGDEAQINPGMTFTVAVAKDTPLRR